MIAVYLYTAMTVEQYEFPCLEQAMLASERMGSGIDIEHIEVVDETSQPPVVLVSREVPRASPTPLPGLLREQAL